MAAAIHIDCKPHVSDDECKGMRKRKAPLLPSGTSGAIFLVCGIKFFLLWYYLSCFCGIIYEKFQSAR
ncbi:MAG TPA: hypothetical protein DDW28_06860 [Prevotella sp.]|nr:hypothetical protein [Candidatus Segatella violae]